MRWFPGQAAQLEMRGMGKLRRKAGRASAPASSSQPARQPPCLRLVGHSVDQGGASLAQRTQHGVHHAGHGWDEMLQAGGRQQAQLSSQLLLQAGGGSGHSMACQGIA